MKGYIKNGYKKIIRYPVTVWMIASMLVLSTIYVVYAAYNGTAEVKRVVSTQASSSTVFSSNYMEPFSSNNFSIKNLRTTNASNFICTITVCNYDQLDPTSPAQGEIVYKFTAELVEYDSTSNTYKQVTTVKMNGSSRKTFYVQKTTDENQEINYDDQHDINAPGNFSYTYQSESLTGGTSVKDTFEICFDASEVAKDRPELFIKVTAEPTQESIQLNSGITSLSSIISVSQGRLVETGWHGNLQESSDKDYDGYNLVIEGSGAGTIEILWDNNKFAINPAFVTLYGGTGGILTGESDVAGRNGWKKMTLSVDSMRSNRYVVQFYKKEKTVYTGTDFASNYIKCENYQATVVNENGTGA